MSALRKPVAALIGVMAMLLAGMFFAVGSATAVPNADPTSYPAAPSATLSISDSTPAAGAADTVTGAGYQPNEDVSLVLHSVVTSLGTVTADGSGAFTTSVTIPAGTSGSHEIVGTGLTSGEVASVAIEVGSSSTGTGTGNGSGSGSGLSNTGVAVIGIGALGVVLLFGGGLLLMAGKRRKVSV